MPSPAELEAIVLQSVRAVHSVPDEELDLDVPLFGQPDALFDSFAIVQLIFELERNISKSLKREVKFTMQQLLAEKENPFHTVRNLRDFLTKTLDGKSD